MLDAISGILSTHDIASLRLYNFLSAGAKFNVCEIILIPILSTFSTNLFTSIAVLYPGIDSNLSTVPPVNPSPLPDIFATATPHDATSGSKTKDTLSPTPPVECLSTIILFNFDKNKQIFIKDENLVKNGIEFILPYNEKSCIMKTGYSVAENNRHENLTKEEAAVESLFVLNIQQFISDLQLDQSNLIMNAVDQAYYDTTIVSAKIIENFLIYSKVNYESNDENIIFYDIETKEIYTCINKTTSGEYLLKNATVIEDIPYMIMNTASGTQFFNLISNEIDATYSEEYDIRFVNNNTVISTTTEKTLFGKEFQVVCIHKFPNKKVILQEKGEYIGCVTSDKNTSYIFLK